MFVDASAIVAILTSEPAAQDLLDRLDTAESAITSPIAIFEAAAGIRRKRRSTAAEALADVQEFLALSRIRTVAIEALDAAAAIDAFGRFGKGSGHPAQLNMGDCFAYAVARRANAPMLFTGEDFLRTDAPVAGR